MRPGLGRRARPWPGRGRGRRDSSAASSSGAMPAAVDRPLVWVSSSRTVTGRRRPGRRARTRAGSGGRANPGRPCPLDELHHGERGDRLRQRPDHERGRGGHRPARGVGGPEPALVDDAAVADDDERSAGDAGVADLRLEPAVDGGGVGRARPGGRLAWLGTSMLPTTSGASTHGGHEPDVAADQGPEAAHRRFYLSVVQDRDVPALAGSAWIDTSVGRTRGRAIPRGRNLSSTARRRQPSLHWPRWTSTSSRRSRPPPSARRSTASWRRSSGRPGAAGTAASATRRSTATSPTAATRRGRTATCCCRRSTRSRRGSGTSASRRSPTSAAG